MKLFPANEKRFQYVFVLVSILTSVETSRYTKQEILYSN
jgi:hypothetical protein